MTLELKLLEICVPSMTLSYNDYKIVYPVWL